MANNYQKPIEKMTDEEKINLCRGLIIIMLVAMFLFFFFGWCYIYNTGYGVEVNCNGWNFICQSFVWDLESENPAFGDISLFYYFAEDYIFILQILTTIIFYFTLGLCVLAFLGIKFKRHSRLISTFFMIVSIAYSALFLAAFVVALTINGSRILPEYCSGNPACSVQSLIIFPFLLSLGIMAINIYLRFKLGKKDVEQVEQK